LIDGRLESVSVAGVRRSSWVKAIVEDRQGRLWLGLDRGGVRFSRASFQDALRTPGRMMSDGFDVFDGLPGTIRLLSDVAGMRTPDDQIWFTTDEGMAVIDPDASLPDLGIVPARITAALADNVRVAPAGGERLVAGTSRLRLSWGALDLTAPERVRFRYRLDGADREWRDAGTAREVEYANLGPGSYVFHVAATREGTTWNDASDASWEFTIAPRFYQTFWFPFLATAMIASAAWATWHMRMTQARRRFAITLAERARVSREVHDTLLQSMVGVSLQCQALAESTDGAAVGDKLVQLRRRIDEHIEEGRELIWNLRSPTLEKYDLVAALRRIADEVVAGTNVRVELVTSGKVHSCAPRAERELLRIGQEAITNAVRHGKPTLVKVELLFDEKALHLRVVDDGCGFAPNATLATADRHCGLVMMRERAEDIQGTCTVTSSPGGGTRVTATAPLVPERA
jgi:signal transduction histidine kinase